MASSSGGDPSGSSRARLPRFMDQRNEFGELIVLQMTASDGRLPVKPFMIAESVERLVGQIDSARSEKQGASYTICVRNVTQAEKLLRLKTLVDGTAINVTHHPFLNKCKCVISTYDLIEETEKDILEKLAEQHVTEVRRITRMQNEKAVNTPALILTFGKTTYPQRVRVGLLSVPTRPYYPNPLLCFGCYNYGHTKKQCTEPAICYNCSGSHVVDECTEDAFCRNCNQSHNPRNRKCPRYQKEVSIIRTKIDFNLSFADAKKRVEQGNVSYAQVTAQPRIDAEKVTALLEANKQKDEQISKLIVALKDKNRQMEELQNTVLQMQQHIEQVAHANLETSDDLTPQASTEHQQARITTKIGITKRKNNDKHDVQNSDRRQQNNSPDNQSPVPKRILTRRNGQESEIQTEKNAIEQVAYASDTESETMKNQVHQALHDPHRN